MDEIKKIEETGTEVIPGGDKLNMDVLIEAILAGDNYRKMAKDFGVTLSVLHGFLHYKEHSARTRDALQTSANTYTEMAEQALIDAKDKGMAEVQRARELAQHYRWMASKRKPREFGDKIELSGDKENPLTVQITGMKID